MSVNLDEGDIISFDVSGVPAPGGSKNAFAIKRGGRYTGRVALVDAGGTGNKLWRAAVRSAAVDLGCKPIEGPVELRVTFRMMRPKKHFHSTKKKLGLLREDAPIYHIFAPDVTKLLRSTEDALKGVTWLDDSQVCIQSAEKVYSPDPGARITITRL